MFKKMKKRGVFSNKKAYFFIVDAFIGTLIISITLMIIMNSHITAPESTNTYTIINDYMRYLSTTEVQDVNNNYTKELIENKTIKRIENTILLQNIDFYYRNGTDCPKCITVYAYNFTRHIVEGVIPEQYGFKYEINNTVIYSRDINKLNQAQMHLSSQRISYLVINKTTIFGPITTKILVWK